MQRGDYYFVFWSRSGQQLLNNMLLSFNFMFISGTFDFIVSNSCSLFPNITWTCWEHNCLTSRQHSPIFILLHYYCIHEFPWWNNPHASWRGCGSAHRDSLNITRQSYVSWCFQKYSRKIPVLSGTLLVTLSKLPQRVLLHPLLNEM